MIDKIIQNPLFLRLKEVTENNGYHDHEAVYDHLIKTKDIATKEIAGDFITNQEAKALFLKFINEDFHGMKRADIMVLITLLHDVGKILFVKADTNLHSMLVTDDKGVTFCPGHEFEGSKIVGEFIKDLGLSKEVVEYVSSVIRNHDTFNQFYMEGRKDWPQDILISDIRSRADGLYLETMFNIYCDCFTATPFQSSKEMLVKLFNNPLLYEQRQYIIP